MNAALQRIVVAVIAFIIIFGGLSYAIYTKYDEKTQLEAQITDLKAQIDTFDAKINTRTAKEKVKADIEGNFENLVLVLPTASPKQADNVLNALTSYAAQWKMEPKNISIKQKPSGQQGFERTQLDSKWQGDFANTMRFVNAIENNTSFLMIDELTLDPVKGDPAGRMNVSMKVSTFHYASK